MLNIVTAIMVRLQRDEKGASAVEYAILVGAIAIGVAAVATTFGTSLGTAITNISSKF